ncbi:MAG: peptidoglycan-binding protein [Patescibacteria group bacterium]
MKKLYIAPILLALSMATASVAVAQTYYPYASLANCTGLTKDLALGSRDSEVATLQNFLVSQNYPGGGSWMVTGYFGQATAQAVRNFQSGQGLLSTGIVDSSTRSAVARVSCGAQPNVSYYNQPSTYPYSYNYNTGNLAITTLSANTGYAGSSVTIYGVGFDSYNNTVNLGTISLGNISSNGSSLSFTVPSYSTNGTVDLRVTNSRGTSNPLSFTIYGYPISCGAHTSYAGPYGTSCNCGNYTYGMFGSYTNNNCGGNFNPNAIVTPAISYLNPNSGGVGNSVTVLGSGFTTTGNSVRFGTGVIANLNSPDGKSVSFTLPSQLTGFGTQPLTLNTYNVYVTNSAGYQSNTVPFTVTSLGASSAPMIWSVNGPTSLSIGATGVWSVVVNNPGNSPLTTSVNWGDQGVGGSIASQPQVTLAQGTQTLSFSHTYATGGIYTITFTASNASGSQTSSATVSVPFVGTSNIVTLLSLSPSAGRVGTQIALLGSGFTALDNTVHFGVGGTQHVVSTSGSTIYFTIPYSVSPCDLISFGCYAPSVQVAPGSYPIYITNAMGATSPISFLAQ